MLIFANDCPKSWKIGEAHERRFIFHSHKTGCIRNHSILWDTRSNPVWGQIVSLCYSCVIQHISIVLKATEFSQLAMRTKQTKTSHWECTSTIFAVRVVQKAYTSPERKKCCWRCCDKTSTLHFHHSTCTSYQCCKGEEAVKIVTTSAHNVIVLM